MAEKKRVHSEAGDPVPRNDAVWWFHVYVLQPLCTVVYSKGALGGSVAESRWPGFDNGQIPRHSPVVLPELRNHSAYSISVLHQCCILYHQCCRVIVAQVSAGLVSFSLLQTAKNCLLFLSSKSRCSPRLE